MTGERGRTRARWLETVGLLALCLLGLWARWDRLWLAEFAADQAWVLSRARDLVHGGEWPLVGIGSSSGAAQGAVEIYLLALPAALSADPLVATAFIGLLQMLAVVGTYFFTAHYFDRPVAWAATALYACNPWALHFGRKLWTPDLLPLFSLLFFAALYAAAVERRRHAFTLACLAFALLFFIHPQVVVYAPLLLGLAFVTWRRWGLPPLLLGAAGALLVAAPYLHYDAQRGFANLRSYLGAAGATAQFDLEGLRQLAMMASGAGFPGLMSYGLRGDPPLLDLTVPNAVATALLVAGLAYALWRVARGRGRARFLLLSLWLLLPGLFTARHAMNLLPHYFLVAYPAQFILMGLALARPARWLARRGGPEWVRPAGGLAGTATLSLCLIQLLFFSGWLDAVEREGPTWPYGVPLTYSQQLAGALPPLVQSLGAPPVYVYAFNQRLALDYLLGPALHLEHVDPPLQLVLPRDLSRGALFVLAANDAATTPQTFPVIGDDGPIIAGLRALGAVELPQARLDGPGSYAYYRLFHLSTAPAAAARAAYRPPEQQLALANGLSLAGVSLPPGLTAGEALSFSLLWQMPADPERFAWSEYVLTAHLVDAGGRDLAQHDWEVWQYLGWQKDGYVVADYELPLPATDAPRLVWLEVGAYERYSRQPVRWTDAAGQAQGPTYRLGPLPLRPAQAPAAPEVRLEGSFGGVLWLEGYDRGSAPARAGQGLPVWLHWRTQSAPERDYTVSVQLLDPAGRLVAQHDAPPVAGAFPTSHWQAGEQVVDVHALELPANLAAGAYQLQVVVYDSATGQRLQSAGADAAPLGTVQVEAAGR